MNTTVEQAENKEAKPTAILIVHGIGHQNPIETIDQFARTLIRSLEINLNCQVNLSHGLAKKKRSDGVDVWFDNYLRIALIKDGKALRPPIDIYEYYWAHQTEDQATLLDISSWVSRVTKGAKKFYKDNKNIGLKYDDKSVFFQNRKFQYWKYWFFVYLIGGFLPALSYFFNVFLKAISYIPVVGIPFRWFAQSFADSKLKYIANVIGDIAIYNTTDEKCRFYRIRQEILTGAVKAIRYLLEAEDARTEYDHVLIAGHSLGSQIAYDAINRLIHLADTNELKGYEGDHKEKLRLKLAGLVTFGSPLDKIAFFLRENVANKEYIRAQLLNNFHSFKQRDWSPGGSGEWPHKIEPVFQRLLEDLPWINFYDKRDYVSGSLDYYQHLENVDMKFDSKLFSFTHSWYWKSPTMFAEITNRFLK